MATPKSRRAIARQVLIDKAYVVFIIWQCEACITALHRGRGASDAARRLSDVTEKTHFANNQQAFSDFQSALTFAGNVSKMIWPVATSLRKHEVKAALSRGRRIRKILGIRARDRVLLRSPSIRNNFEHLDLRVDVWAQATTGTSIGVHALANDRALSRISPGDRFTRYDPDKEIFSMLDDRISLKQLEASVKRVWSAAASVYHGILRFEARFGKQESTV